MKVSIYIFCNCLSFCNFSCQSYRWRCQYILKQWIITNFLNKTLTHANSAFDILTVIFFSMYAQINVSKVCICDAVINFRHLIYFVMNHLMYVYFLLKIYLVSKILFLKLCFDLSSLKSSGWTFWLIDRWYMIFLLVRKIGLHVIYLENKWFKSFIKSVSNGFTWQRSGSRASTCSMNPALPFQSVEFCCLSHCFMVASCLLRLLKWHPSFITPKTYICSQIRMVKKLSEMFLP